MTIKDYSEMTREELIEALRKSQKKELTQRKILQYQEVK